MSSRYGATSMKRSPFVFIRASVRSLYGSKYAVQMHPTTSSNGNACRFNEGEQRHRTVAVTSLYSPSAVMSP